MIQNNLLRTNNVGAKLENNTPVAGPNIGIRPNSRRNISNFNL